MAIQFIRRRLGARQVGGPDYEPAVKLRVPAELLDRHEGRVLDPRRAEAAGGARPRTTAYRPRVLLVPDDVLCDPAAIGAVRAVLNAAGYDLEVPRSGGGASARPVALRALTGRDHDVDSWAALQRLRAAADDVLDWDLVRRISLEHLVFSAVTINGTPWDTNSDQVTGSYRRSPSGSSRVPVAIAVEPPRRDELGDRFTRRPVVAVLDSGIGPHPWFDIADRSAPPPADGFISVLDEAQRAIRDNAVAAPSLLDYWDSPVVSESLIRDVDSNTGHGTFIAGIIRQAAPNADVLAIRVMHSDGVAYGSDVIAALEEISRRVDRARREDRPGDMVDVVSLSLGYLDESPADSRYTTHLAEVVRRLTEQGVLVLAASGNNSTGRRFYPAAFADLPDLPGAGPGVISVGALNPNDTKASFSNDGAWVTCWATGAGVVSTFPTDVSGPRQPELADEHRSGLDPDDFRSGFAVWDGTSFATPLAAAAVANALIDVAAADTGLSLAAVDQETVVKRAWAALERCYEQYEV
ncbi:S8 family serine peptidase [Actinosynnema sp. NPDC047251]|uniref:Peptidase S8/S53, subtilisin kexin sedolisin n=1 Tax=Saccharothrix espanaensis (strain ATCC 51144 / DSM 44229 / JCM 9112 / NBRC 15066 / NRRL 15764) TaxID=1179773 RepID=K0JYW5_SACES|nr:S8 family serine peptidase [Saccharothrix espanaensis]CCH31331.1 Peptidase S8/S53, subtilisin kexin sedolisin [Saccharothrix espanaensis DSM 44229]